MVKQIEGASTSVGINWDEYKGKLFVIEPLDVEKDIKTVHGLSDAVVANVYVVRSADGSKFESYEDTLIFPRALRRQTKSKVGKIVVGRLTQGEAQRGQNPPWLFAEPTESDLAAARGTINALNAQALSAPASTGEDEGFDDGFEETPSKSGDDGEF